MSIRKIRTKNPIAGGAQALVDELREVPQAPVLPPPGPAADEPIRPRAAPAPTSTSGALDGVFEDLEAAIGAAVQSFERWSSVPLEGRARAIEAMREATRKHAEELSRLAVEETGLGNIKDKIAKNLLCANKTPGIEILRPQAFTGDHGMTLDERAPFGVIGAITPSTNPTETIINNAIGMVAAGNCVVFNVHPAAKRVSARHIQLMNQAIAG